MWAIITQMIFCLLAALGLGILIGWALSKLFAQNAAAKLTESLESKVKSYERDLDKARGDLRTHKDQLSTLKSELAASTDKLKARDLELGDLEAKIKTMEGVEANLAAKTSELDSLNVEFTALKKKLADAEAALSKPPQPDPKLQAELDSLRQSAGAKDTEIATLLVRVKELAPLGLQIKDRDLRLREWETKHTEALKGKDDEIAKLSARVKEFEIAAQNTQSVDSEKDVEISRLKIRIGELESKASAAGEFETRLLDIEGKYHAALEASRSKDDEIASLAVRVKEFEGIDDKFADRDKAFKELQDVITAKDAEISQLRHDSGEYASLREQLNDCGAKLRDAESKLRAQDSQTNAEVEIARLRSRISDLETMHNRAVTPPPKSEWDDLVDIYGVGPVLEKMLHKLGIYTFKQVALWNDEQIEWVDSQLEHFHGRIRRENWIDSAKDEHFKKYGEKI